MPLSVSFFFDKGHRIEREHASRQIQAEVFAVYLLSDLDGPPTAFPLFEPQCTVGVLAGTHWGALRCPGKDGVGDKAPTLICCTAEPVLTRAAKHTPSVKHTCRGFWPTWIAPTTVFVTFTPFVTS